MAGDRDVTFEELQRVNAPSQTESASEFRPIASVSTFSLTVSGGPDRGLTHTENAGRAVIGTHGKADLRLSDPTVSRFHCSIEVTDERVKIQDLGSRNGTRVDGVHIETAFLGRNAALRLGKSTVQFELGPAVRDIELSESPRFGALIGESVVMRQTFARLRRVAENEHATVLLLGESGTGKELAAEAVHEHSPRSNRPFVVVDCAAMNPALLESELFGHTKGAFTGADRDRPGAFELAQGGTIFLDEVGELSLEMQPKLLRALEARTVSRVGENRDIAIDVRVIAATHRPLEKMVNSKTFRSDLYFRLAVVPIELPPLRRRLDDLPLLIEAIARDLGLEQALVDELLDPDRQRNLRGHFWPGNVRELRNYLLQCRVQEETVIPQSEASFAVVDIAEPFRSQKDRWLQRLERDYIVQLHEVSDGNVSEMAARSGLTRASVYRLLRQAGLK